ncbi:4,5-DOPA dioxygenase extradiol [Myroides odoratimimus]|uniref:4,5-DOPA-extradiol-dioxygenase n=1 Tax=Myroides odoratimimus TaxID=76832 RepID=UPI002575AB29|nr:4,5-DOPA dioxygenase extradiol [Myroides odoratimimus]MDM1098177.1 4,5-DOPA dioxygenase extradiol [Myroides odoratimimus]MDM1328295.1 4,5-DOPA dioxygenase extradiol [Myroides odoratimimus]MDM1444899.1 4,5-DOPA dioxygenase extradiol [Myroides odoratimimus]MDM1451298.1 4,5-DOPA dioxygenase extradiol [Myroides odoratimimus]MDM1454404.1 4,5-DOPA dioxygenase extradiol [Myroides odoratimimus]
MGEQVLNDLFWLKDRAEEIPVLFVGHGSPMNAVEDNEFSQYWKKLGKQLPKPEAILVVSAHWLTKGTLVTANSTLETIHDFRGFPKALFDVEYNVKGNPILANEITLLSEHQDIHEDLTWGLDHGAWSILCHLFPEANIPVLQLSVDYYKGPNYHLEIGKQLKALRKKGVLIIGSGNIVHNLSALDWHHMNEDNYAFDWAKESNELVKTAILNRNFTDLLDYKNKGVSMQYAVPTPDHYYPLLYILGLTSSRDNIHIFNDKYVGGSLSMTSYLFG